MWTLRAWAREVGQQLRGNCGTPGFRAPEVGPEAGYCGFVADVYSLGRTLQAAAKVEPTWRELVRVSRQMAAEDPARRPGLEAVRASLFGSGGDAHPTAEPGAVVLDFNALESVSCRDASGLGYVRGSEN